MLAVLLIDSRIIAFDQRKGNMKYERVPSELPRVKGQVLPRCVLCEEVPVNGIAGGYLINGMFLCETCESAIVELEVGSSRYKYYVERIKRLLR